MYTIQINSGKPGPHVLITAGVHGDEYEPMLAAVALAEQVRGKLRSGVLTIVPLVNASAFHSDSRFGADGKDLARICPGDANGTSSEVAAAEVSRLIRTADYLIDLHTGGRALVMQPLAGYMLHADPVVLAAQREMAACFNLPLTWGTESTPEGRTLSVARDAGIPAIYVEYGGGDTVSEGVTAAYVRGCLNILRWLGMAAGRSAVSQVQWQVEDPSPDGGYLQGKMPAPAAGIFLPAVQAGEIVRRGQKWGTIMTMPDGRHMEIKVSGKGLALFHRKAGYVKAGDALGGVLPINRKYHYGK
ncbi:succinylglutamate desuccinylase/aspartoacylase family protein [Chitinophaga lutea]